jgi:spore coat polysaccharide biosynthesis protein SpsF
MNVLGVIQARMSSSRLPGKVLADLGGISVLELMIHRLRKSRALSKLIVATTNSSSDDELALVCEKLGVEIFRGSEFDVLDRFNELSKAFPDFEHIVRLTADCPFIDPYVVDLVVKEYFLSGAAYCSNRLPPPYSRTYPVGLDVEVFSRVGLLEASREARAQYEREHVTPYFYTQGRSGKVKIIDMEPDLSEMRLTIDTLSDLNVCRLLYKALPSKDSRLTELVEAWEKLDLPKLVSPQRSFKAVDNRWKHSGSDHR